MDGLAILAALGRAAPPRKGRNPMATAVSPPLAPAPRTTPRPRRRSASPAPETPQVSVVIVNFRQWQNTARLTRQLLNSDSARRGLAEIIIVDNRSPNDRRAHRLRCSPGVSLRRFAR